jgi:hypothetical protein
MVKSAPSKPLFSTAEKAVALQMLTKYSFKEAAWAASFKLGKDVSVDMLRWWKRAAEEAEETKDRGSRKSAEEQVAEEAREMNAKGKTVAGQWILERFAALREDGGSPVSSSFLSSGAAQRAWLHRWRKRWAFTVRRTGAGAEFKSDEECRLAAASFVLCCQARARAVGTGVIFVNIDETPLFKNMDLGSGYIAAELARDFAPSGDQSAKKQRVTLMAALSSSPAFQPPCCLLDHWTPALQKAPAFWSAALKSRGSVRDKIFQPTEKLSFIFGPTSSFRSESVLRYIQLMKKAAVAQNIDPKRIVIILDAARQHKVDCVKAEMESFGGHVYVPGGFTWLLQPLDVVSFRSAKCAIRLAYWRSFVLGGESQGVGASKLLECFEKGVETLAHGTSPFSLCGVLDGPRHHRFPELTPEDFEKARAWTPKLPEEPEDDEAAENGAAYDAALDSVDWTGMPLTARQKAAGSWNQPTR